LVADVVKQSIQPWPVEKGEVNALGLHLLNECREIAVSLRSGALT